MPAAENVESTLIWYRGTAAEDFKHWKDSLIEFLEGKAIETTYTYEVQNIFRSCSPPHV